MPGPAPIFVNYRRTKTRDKALILRLILEKEFGAGVVFLDERSIGPGEPWEQELKDAVENCKVLLSLIHADWHKDQDYESGEKSLAQPDDWIRQEIATALQAKKIVIPVLINEAYLQPRGQDKQRNEPPKQEWLPSEIRGLFGGQLFRLRFDDLTPERLQEFLGHLKDRLPEAWRQREQAEPQRGGYYPGVLRETFPLPDDLQQAEPTSPAPYVGLRPFHREDARLFFGRSREIYELCFKLTHQPQRLLLLDGYSGTGKSSLMQAGVIPRMEAQGWTVVYVRREEDKSGGLPALLAAKQHELADAAGEKLIILDQVEEILTNPIIHLPDEVPALINGIVNALEDDPSLRIIMGFRSEYATHLKRELDQHVERPEYDVGNTVYTLGRPGLVEAIRSVSVDRSLNGPGKPYRLRFRPSDTLPGTIADHLLDSKAGSHIAPLLQVNLELLWQRCRRDDGIVEITGQAIRDIIDTHEALLDHYVEMIRREVTSAQVDDQRLLELLHYYVEQKPASALRLDHEFQQKFGSDTFAELLRDQCKRLFLLYSKGSGEDTVTRLSHDSLAEVIDGRYNQLTQAKVASRGSLAFESLRREIDEQISSLRFREALDTLDQLMMVEELRQELYAYLFELCFFWNEAGGQEETKRILSHWIDSGLLADQLDLVTRLSTDPDRQQIRGWLGAVDPPCYRDMQSRYLAPEQTVMVPIVGGEFLMGDETGDLGDECRPVHPVRLDAFRLANVPVTWWQFGLYLFAIQQEQDLESKGGSGGVQGNHPVASVSWYEAVAYCNWLSEHVGLEPAYVIDRDQSDPNNLNEKDEQKWTVRVVDGVAGYRLPSEAEWEYACRAATTTRYSFGDQEDQLSEYAWFEDNSDSHAHPVGAKKPNAWGLYDMHGNVWEWCKDWFGESYYEEIVDSNPKGPDRGSFRVIRGGSWGSGGGDCRSAYRRGGDPEYRYDFLGFRLARSSVESSTRKSGA